MEIQSTPLSKVPQPDEDLIFPLPAWFMILTTAKYILKRIGFFLFQPPHITKPHPSKILTIGHRGARGSHPENSREAFEYAVQVADGFELDTQVSQDCVPIVLHDSTLDRTTTGSGKVLDLVWSNLLSYRLENGEKIPSLQEVLELYSKKSIINIEIKKEATPDLTRKSAKEICRVIGKFFDPKSSSSIIISSFSPLTLYYCKKFLPRVPRAQLIADPYSSGLTGWRKVFLSSWLPALAWEASGVVWEKSLPLRKPQMVEKAHSWNIICWIYTSNEIQEWKLCAEIGIDGVITDRPEKHKEFTCQFSGDK